ncbi:MAG: hypothetical protein J6386_10985 [Candidatus Synoicihabitans palmerolidicus]|nr:hypothetical protein [Candidatus Synoicihabitans palmerolidicus]
MARPVNPLIIDAAQHQELEQMIKRPTTPQLKSWIKWRNQRHAKAHGVERIALHSNILFLV